MSQLIAAVLLDLLFGDPPGRFHPVRALGAAASFCRKQSIRLLGNTRAAGAVSSLACIGAALAVSSLLLAAAAAVHPLLHWAVSVLLICSSLAVRDLAGHARRVYVPLTAGSIDEARRFTGYLVSRSTGSMDAPEMVRAVVESTAENTSDSITAPLFYAALFGPLGAVGYRCVNTMDAMFGYRTPEYLHFGCVPAKIDDLLNYLPARLCAVLLAFSAPLTGGSLSGSLRMIRRDGRKHESPNAGYPEAAVAGALGVQLGGPSVYFGRTVKKPEIGDPLRPLHLSDIPRTVSMMYAAAGLSLAAAAGIASVVLLLAGAG